MKKKITIIILRATQKLELSQLRKLKLYKY